MKHIHIQLEDAEVEQAEKLKGDRSWKDMLLKGRTPEVAHFANGYHWFFAGEHGGPFETLDDALNDFVDNHEIDEDLCSKL